MAVERLATCFTDWSYQWSGWHWQPGQIRKFTLSLPQLPYTDVKLCRQKRWQAQRGKKSNLKCSSSYLFEAHMKRLKPISALVNKRRTSNQLRKILDESGRLYICDWCRCEKMTLSDGEWLWRGLPLKLQIDHIHGVDGTENQDSLDNLRYLCPNCHSQTPNFCGKQQAIKRRRTPLWSDYAKSRSK